MIHNLPTCRLLCIDVPEGAERFSFGFEDHQTLYWYPSNAYNSFDSRSKPLPPGNWELLGRRDEIKEDEWSDIVHSDVNYSNGTPTIVFKDYRWPLEVNRLLTATESARSLIAGNPVVLIERKKE
jgi:hypothetical protein